MESCELKVPSLPVEAQALESTEAPASDAGDVSSESLTEESLAVQSQAGLLPDASSDVLSGDDRTSTASINSGDIEMETIT